MAAQTYTHPAVMKGSWFPQPWQYLILSNSLYHCHSRVQSFNLQLSNKASFHLLFRYFSFPILWIVTLYYVLILYWLFTSQTSSPIVLIVSYTKHEIVNFHVINYTIFLWSVLFFFISFKKSFPTVFTKTFSNITL